VRPKKAAKNDLLLILRDMKNFRKSEILILKRKGFDEKDTMDEISKSI